MGLIIDSSLWIDYFRSKTPRAVKERVIAYIDDPLATLCEPVRFEILRGASKIERKSIDDLFATFPLEENPPALWERAIVLGQKCKDAGIHPPGMDLLIAQISLDKGHGIVCYDKHFVEIAKVCPLRVKLLIRETTSKLG
jgi:predicted nucleic acid-binding protein